MKISFGLPSTEKKPPTAAAVARPLPARFFDHEAQERPSVKRARVTEMVNGLLQVSYSSADTDISQVQRNADGQCVIPCANRLDDLAKEAPNPAEKEEIKLPEIRYGLNVLPAGLKREAKHQKTPKGPTADSSVTDIAGDTKALDGTKNDSVMSCKIQNDGSITSDGCPGVVPIDEKVSGGGTISQDNEPTDAYVARTILNDIEKQKLREMLFGDNLVEKASNTLPILLRSKSNRRQQDVPTISEAPNTDSSSYENVPVEDFGLAMLLGMGFDPKANNNNKPKEYKRRVYERAGLGADAHMKHNMEALTNASVMAKLKKDQMYHQYHDLQDPKGTAATTWLLPGLYVRVVERDHSHFGEKGVVTKADGTKATLNICGNAVSISPKGVETVVSLDATKCKVVRRIARHTEKFYVPIGTIVDIARVTKTYAKIVFREQNITVSLDDICEFR